MEISSLVVPAFMGTAGWFGTHFVAKPILEVRETRLEALKIAERYLSVNFASSDELRDRALRAMNDTASALRALSRERSLAVRFWCRLFGYDLHTSSRCLLGLAEGPRGEYQLGSKERTLTLNALFVSLGASQHLSRAEIAAVKDEIKKAVASDAID
jgi:hypothetical protein